MLTVKNRKFFLKLTFFELFLFAALRYQFGNDYMSYYDKYLLIHRGGNPFRAEPLFAALCRVMPSYYWLVAFVSLVYICAFYHLVNNNIDSKYVWASLALLLINPYIFLIDLSAMRQSLAISIFIFAVNFAYNKKLFPYVALILLAVTIHTSAIVLLPIYFIINIKRFNKKIIIIFVCVFVIFLFNGKWFNGFMEFALKQFEGRTSWSYSNYYLEGNKNSLRAAILSSITLFYILLNISSLEGKTSLYARLWLIGTVLNILCYRLSMLSRVEMYFNVFSVVAFPLTWYQVKCKRTFKSKVAKLIDQLVLPVLMVTVLVLRYYSFFTTPLWEPFRVYHTIFELL